MSVYKHRKFGQFNKAAAQRVAEELSKDLLPYMTKPQQDRMWSIVEQINNSFPTSKLFETLCSMYDEAASVRKRSS